MDAKITKARLGNYLSYEWIKIFVVAALAAVLVIVVFMTASTRLSEAGRYLVMTYNEVYSGEEFDRLESRLERITSYEIQATGVLSMSDTQSDSAETLYSTRRAVNASDAMFIPNVAAEGEISALTTLVRGEPTVALDPEKLLSDCAEYLNPFFGGDYQNGALDEEAVEAEFYARNANDKRFKTEEQKANGVALERQRITKLCNDLKVVYAALSSAEGEPLLTFVSIVHEDGEAQKCAIDFGSPKLSGLSELVYRSVERVEEEGATPVKVNSNEGLCLLIFNNFGTQGVHVYESVSFISYLVQEYGAN